MQKWGGYVPALKKVKDPSFPAPGSDACASVPFDIYV